MPSLAPFLNDVNGWPLSHLYATPGLRVPNVKEYAVACINGVVE